MIFVILKIHFQDVYREEEKRCLFVIRPDKKETKVTYCQHNNNLCLK